MTERPRQGVEEVRAGPLHPASADRGGLGRRDLPVALEADEVVEAHASKRRSVTRRRSIHHA
jgi:hypothetical protein